MDMDLTYGSLAPHVHEIGHFFLGNGLSPNSRQANNCMNRQLDIHISV